HCALRVVRHNDPLAGVFHRQLAPLVSALAGRPLKPSYSYVASYEPGALLRVHRDRAQCEYSLSILIDFVPEPALAAPWPLHLFDGAGRVTLFQALGDAVLYRGREILHYRDAFLSGQVSTSMLLHYVPTSFSDSLE